MDCYNDEVVDQAKILTREQRDKLELKIKEVERKQKVRIGVNIIKKLPDGTEISTYAHKILDERYSDASNGEILLLVDMENRATLFDLQTMQKVYAIWQQSANQGRSYPDPVPRLHYPPEVMN